MLAQKTQKLGSELYWNMKSLGDEQSNVDLLLICYILLCALCLTHTHTLPPKCR